MLLVIVLAIIGVLAKSTHSHKAKMQGKNLAQVAEELDRKKAVGNANFKAILLKYEAKNNGKHVNSDGSVTFIKKTEEPVAAQKETEIKIEDTIIASVTIETTTLHKSTMAIKTKKTTVRPSSSMRAAVYMLTSMQVKLKVLASYAQIVVNVGEICSTCTWIQAAMCWLISPSSYPAKGFNCNVRFPGT